MSATDRPLGPDARPLRLDDSLDRLEQVTDRTGEAGDAADLDLAVRNVLKAVELGGLGTREQWALGVAAVSRVLGGQLGEGQ